MANYETVLIARQDVSSSHVEQMTDQFSEILTNDGANISRREYWGLRNLAFKIKKNRKGHYMLLNFDAPPSAVAEMERVMRYHDDVLRYMTVRTEDLPEEPSIVMQRREERGRGGRDRDRGDKGDRGDRGDRGPRRDRDNNQSRDGGDE